jgi:hypothetical protein
MRTGTGPLQATAELEVFYLVPPPQAGGEAAPEQSGTAQVPRMEGVLPASPGSRDRTL